MSPDNEMAIASMKQKKFRIRWDYNSKEPRTDNDAAIIDIAAGMIRFEVKEGRDPHVKQVVYWVPISRVYSMEEM